VTKPLLVLIAAAALLVGLLQSAEAAPSRPTATAGKGECGLPGKRPLWIDFGDGSVPFWELFAQPGLVSAAANFRYPPQIRARGGNTIYFDLNFHRRLGGPAKPKPLDEVLDSANKLFFYASASSGCNRPWIALNELFGASLPTPWSETNTVYRANVLAFIKVLAAHGAHVFLLVNSKPYTADEAGDWWREVAKYSDFVREVYFPAPQIARQGPVLGNRTLRNAFRTGILDLTSAGIPVTKVGLFLGFQTEKGSGGREGLAKLSWFRTIKWQALAARQVARELKVPTIWSWGWGVWGGGSVDPDKPAAACVYLWARNHSLCDGPKVAGRGFNTSMTEGQINLPKGVQCLVDDARLSDSAMRGLTRVTRDRQVAYSAVFARTIESKYADADPKDVLALERAVVAVRFHGSYAGYRAALAKEHANVALARGVLADELRQAAIESRIKVSSPSSSAVSSFYDDYGSLPARLVTATPEKLEKRAKPEKAEKAQKREKPEKAAPPAWWLGGKKSGLAISSIAPDQVFKVKAGRTSAVVSPSGEWEVKPLGPVAPLAAFPLAKARLAISAGLRQNARTSAYQNWTAVKQRSALKQTACRRDDLPSVGAVDLTSYLPFLAL
jgi:hypothetical protein